MIPLTNRAAESHILQCQKLSHFGIYNLRILQCSRIWAMFYTVLFAQLDCPETNQRPHTPLKAWKWRMRGVRNKRRERAARQCLSLEQRWIKNQSPCDDKWQNIRRWRYSLEKLTKHTVRNSWSSDSRSM